MLDRMGSRMIQTLNLTPAQAEQVRTIIDELRPDFEAAEPRELMLKLKEAQAAGDEQQIAALETRWRRPLRSKTRCGSSSSTALNRYSIRQQQQGLEQPAAGSAASGAGAVRLEGMIERLPEELQLTPEQRQKYDELAAAWRAARDQNREQRRALTRELTEAQKAGNEELLEELRQKLQEVRANRPSDAFYAGLEKILTKEQSEKLSEMRGVWGGPGERQRGLRVRTVVRAAERLDLTKEQREAIREITRQAMRQAREAKPEERAQTESQIAERLKKDITALLTPEQVTQFEQALKEGGRRGPAALCHRLSRPLRAISLNRSSPEKAGRRSGAMLLLTEPQGSAKANDAAPGCRRMLSAARFFHVAGCARHTGSMPEWAMTAGAIAQA